ncbi:MAG TPA: hypothetical protein VHJ34_06690 [Actinomycetota bacterium]|nr:hypothetical protein [Actinomycetota bacterium]
MDREKLRQAFLTRKPEWVMGLVAFGAAVVVLLSTNLIATDTATIRCQGRSRVTRVERGVVVRNCRLEDQKLVRTGVDDMLRTAGALGLTGGLAKSVLWYFTGTPVSRRRRRDGT